MMDDKDLERWMKVAEWRGKTYTALEGINKEMEELKDTSTKEFRDIKTQLKTINDRLTNQTIKVGIISGVMGMIGGIFIVLLFQTIMI